MSSDEFFDGGDRVRGFSYQGAPPITHRGKVTEIGNPVQAREVVYNRQAHAYEQGDLKTWPSGDPIMSRRVVVQTDMREDQDDDGRRCWYMEQGKEMTKAMMEAVRAVRGSSMPEVGGDLEVTWTSNDPDSYEGKKKLFTARYQAPVPADDPWGTGAPPAAPQAAPQQGGWGQQAPPPPPQQQAWGAPPASPSPAPPTAAPPQQPAAVPAVDPQLVAFLQSKQVDINGMNPATMQQVAAYMGYRPAAAAVPEPPF